MSAFRKNPEGLYECRKARWYRAFRSIVTELVQSRAESQRISSALRSAYSFSKVIILSRRSV